VNNVTVLLGYMRKKAASNEQQKQKIPSFIIAEQNKVNTLMDKVPQKRAD
jgi:hypothetical protein